MQYVLMGGPSTGKTTIIELLKSKGFVTGEDAARKILRDASAVSPLVDLDAFQQEVLRLQLSAEAHTLKLNEPCFLDGGIFDGCAYYLCAGLEVPAVYSAFDGSRYRKAFLFEPLGVFVADGIRYQDEEFTERITGVLERCYLERGVAVVRVPNRPAQERLELILHSL